MVRIDGSIGEGGGQVVRTALSLSAVTQREVEIAGIRKNRRIPGMRHDLIATVRAFATGTHGRLDGDTLGSDTLRYYPGRVQPGRYELAIGDSSEGTGSVPLLFQALAPGLALAGGTTELVLRGGTHAHASPTVTYLQTVFIPSARKFGLRVEVAAPRWGFAPHGVGEMRARVQPVTTFHAADLTTRGSLLQIGGSSIACGLEEGFAERQKERVNRRLQEVGRQALIQIVGVPNDNAGAMLFLLAVFERTIAGFTSLAGPGISAEQAADEAVNGLFAYIPTYAVLDKHVADQVLVYAALADGKSNLSITELTPHAASTAAIIEAFLPAKVSFDGKVGETVEGEVLGAGLRR
jgi:RNA 3'-terminal phosphate cyclase (ATP)